MNFYLEKEEILEYDGHDKAIKSVRRKLEKNPTYELNKFETDYCSTSIGFGEWHIDSDFTISDDIRTELQKKYKECNSTIHIDDIIGESTDYIQFYGTLNDKKRGYYFIPKKAFDKHPLRNYDNTINFDSIERLDKKGRLAYPYQKVGANFLLKEKRCILGDDKGLGKTYQAIVAAIAHGQKTLVVCLASTKKNWHEEVSSITRKCIVINGEKNYPSTKNSDFLIINYDIIHAHKDKLKLENFGCVILDESQKVTNPKAKMTKAITAIVDFCNPTYVWSLSATPFQKIQDFIPLLQFLGVKDVQTFHMRKNFLDRYSVIERFDKGNTLSVPINLSTQVNIDNTAKKCNIGLKYTGQKYECNQYKMTKGSHGGLRWFFKNLLGTYFDGILTKGGDFYFEVLHGKGADQKRFFSAYSKNATYKEKKKHITEFFKSTYHPVDTEHRTLSLKIHSMVGGIKSVETIFYSWYTIEQIKSTKREHEFRQRFMKKKLLRRLIDDEELKKDIPNITFYKKFITLPTDILDEYKQILADDDLVQQLRHLQFIANAKVPYTIKLIEKEVPKEDKFIVFTTFKEEIALFKEHYGDSCLIIDSSIPTKKRQAITKRLTDDSSIRCIIANIIAGGTGLNIIGANHSYQNSGHFNPNKLNQASGRTRRLGQTKECHYSEVLVEGTEDGHVQKVNEKKNKLINFMLNHDNRY